MGDTENHLRGFGLCTYMLCVPLLASEVVTRYSSASVC